MHPFPVAQKVVAGRYVCPADRDHSDVVYVRSAEHWACCDYNSDGILDCSIPSAETFFRPPPEDLPIYFQIPADGFTYTPTSTTSSAIATSTTLDLARTSTSLSYTVYSATSSASMRAVPSDTPILSGLPTGAAAGIGVGATVAVLLVGVMVFWYMRRRRAQHALPALAMHWAEPGEKGHAKELGSTTTPQELPLQDDYMGSVRKERCSLTPPSELPGALPSGIHELPSAVNAARPR
ncbi:hypothetical protein F5Y18DRAFT_152660 [Xylariaceae sp. FL1019]|nr:hypothetical protein F5Y18DRAFT_152660 [Xylariaceae sp. FL1019]